MQKRKLNKTLLLFLTVLCSYTSRAQVVVKGIIKSENTQEILPYVNVGIINKGIGTVTNDKGNFYLLVQKRQYNDSIKLSMIGYQSKTFLVKDFVITIKKNNTIYLTEKTEALNEVIVTTRKLKQRILGNKSSNSKYEMTSSLLGIEIGILIKIKRSPTYLKSFNTEIHTKKYSSFKFRLNIYDIKDGLPNNNLLKESIYIDKNDIKEDGHINIDLKPYSIIVEDDFFITLELVKDSGIEKLHLPASILGPRLIERETSQASWEKYPLGSMGFNVTVKY